MKISRTTIQNQLATLGAAQLEQMQDAICRNIASGRIGTSWHEVINAIDAELDRRIGYLPPYWATIV